MNVKERYEDALRAFSLPGQRNKMLGRLTYWAVAYGMSLEEVIEAAHAEGVRDRDSDIRRGFATAEKIAWREGEKRVSAPVVRRAPTPVIKALPNFTRTLIETNHDIATLDQLRTLSPTTICAGEDEDARLWQAQTQLVTLFKRDDFVFMRSAKDAAVKAVRGENLRKTRAWLLEGLDALGEVVGVNPVSGREGLTTGGQESYYCKQTVAEYRHFVMEFDEMPLADQCAFWAGIIRRGKLPIRTITYSGSKSLHVVVRADVKNAEEFAVCVGKFAKVYGAGDTPEDLRIDTQSLKSPLTCVRLAGVVRKDTGHVQSLVYAARDWQEKTYQTKLNEVSTGLKSALYANSCATCDTKADCQQAFGDFWGEKSSGGQGCKVKFAYDRLRRNIELFSTQTKTRR